MKKLVCLFAIFCQWHVNAQSILLLSWDFNGLTGAEVSVNANTVANAMEMSMMSRGSGLTPTILNNSFHASNWTTTNSVQDAIANEDYYQWTAQVKPGVVASLHSIQTTFRRSASGPDHFQWRYSLNGVDFNNIGNEIIFTNTTTNGVAQLPLDLTLIPNLQQVNAATQVCFRLYGYNATGSTGTFSIGRLTGDDLILSGIPMITLPIHATILTLRATRDGINITWQAFSDAPQSRFYLERSFDGQQFETIREMEVLEGQHDYQIQDLWNRKLVYYRLRTETPGSADSYGSVAVLRPMQTKEWNIYPNPATTVLLVEGSGGKQLRLFNGAGVLLRVISMQSTMVQLDISGLAAGLYYLSLDNHTFKTFVKK